MKKLKILGSALLLLMAGCSGHSQENPTAPKACYLVKVNDADRKRLPTYFTDFATSHGLKIDQRDPATYVMRDALRGILITVFLPLGDLGACAALYQAADESTCKICEDFNSLLQGKIRQDFEVVPCDAVQGFSVPTLYNVDLHKDIR